MEKNFRTMVERSIQGIVIIQDFRIVYTNQAFAKISSFSKKELLSLTPAQVEKMVHPDHRALVWGRMRERLHGKEVVSRYEYKGYRKDGSVRWLEMMASRIEFEEKPAILGAVIDITERKEAEEALQRSEANLSALIENAQDSIWSIDRDYRLLTINSHFKKMFALAYGVNLKVGMRITDGVTPKMRRTWIARYKRALRGESFIVEEDYKVASETIYAEISFNPIRNNGEISGVSVFSRDITGQKKAQDELRESEARFKVLFEFVPDAYYLSDVKGRFIDGNRAAEKLIGFSKAEFLGKNFLKLKLLSADQLPKAAALLAKSALGKATGPDEFVLRRKDGTTTIVEIRTYPVKIKNETFVLGLARDITARKNAEKALKESEKKFRNIVESSPMGIHLYEHKSDGSLVFIGSNPAADKILDVDNSQFIGKPIKDAFPPLAQTEIPQRYKEAAVNGKSWKTHQVEYEDDKIKGAFEVYAFQTSPQKMATMFLDVTEQKKAEEALRESESRYLALFDRSLYGVFVHDFEGRFLDANKAALNMLGYSTEDISALDFSSLLSEDQLPKAFQGIEEIVEFGYQKKPSVYRLRRKNGTFVWVETEATLISKGGKPYAIQGIARDITEHKQAEEALKESEEKYRVIFESFHDVYYRTDRDGLVTLISPSVRTHAGWEPEDIIGHPVTDFYSDPSERETFKEKLKESGVINDYELKLLAKNGRVIDVSVSSKIILDKNGKPIGVEGVLRDITDRKHSEEQVKSSLREKEVLLQEIHHRVKNNMQIISSLLNLQSRHIENDHVKDMFKMSRDRIRSMALIHEKLYQSQDFARINFAQYIRSLSVHLLQTYNANSGRIKLTAEVEDVFLDINKAIPCGLIINELVSNSLKHAFPEKRKGNLHIQFGTQNNGNLCLVVRDDGVGFSKNVNLQKLDSLGLQLVNDLVDQLGGTLELDLNGGTSYQITFSA